MKTLVRIAFVLIATLALLGLLAYADGARLPVEHSITVSSIISAPPDIVFGLITSVGKGAAWRPAVKSVQVLPMDHGRDHWVEDLGHGQTMTFLAVRTDAPRRREVLLDDPEASYGGTWTYEVSPGDAPGTSNLKITETGFIHPPLYRFLMAHIFGPTRNLDTYVKDMQAAVKKT